MGRRRYMEAFAARQPTKKPGSLRDPVSDMQKARSGLITKGMNIGNFCPRFQAQGIKTSCTPPSQISAPLCKKFISRVAEKRPRKEIPAKGRYITEESSHLGTERQLLSQQPDKLPLPPRHPEPKISFDGVEKRCWCTFWSDNPIAYGLTVWGSIPPASATFLERVPCRQHRRVAVRRSGSSPHAGHPIWFRVGGRRSLCDG